MCRFLFLIWLGLRFVLAFVCPPIISSIILFASTRLAVDKIFSFIGLVLSLPALYVSPLSLSTSLSVLGSMSLCDNNMCGWICSNVQLERDLFIVLTMTMTLLLLTQHTPMHNNNKNNQSMTISKLKIFEGRTQHTQNTFSTFKLLTAFNWILQKSEKVQ